MSNTHSIVLSAVYGVDTERLAKAVCGLADGSMIATVTGQSDREVKGQIQNGDGKYGVVLTPERAFCDCPDSTFRRAVCKHGVALALTVLQTPEIEVEERQPDLRLKRMRTSDELACDQVRRAA